MEVLFFLSQLLLTCSLLYCPASSVSSLKVAPRLPVSGKLQCLNDISCVLDSACTCSKLTSGYQVRDCPRFSKVQPWLKMITQLLSSCRSTSSQSLPSRKKSRQFLTLCSPSWGTCLSCLTILLSSLLL